MTREPRYDYPREDHDDAAWPEPRGLIDHWPRLIPAVIVGAVVLGVVALLAWPADAQERTDDCAHVEAMPGAVVERLTSYGPTTDVLAAARDGTGIVLCYLNHGDKVSNTGSRVLSLDGLEIRAHITVGDGSERITITPPPGWMVWPADYADAPVADGSALTVSIVSGIM